MKTYLKYSIIKWAFICLAGVPIKAFSQLTDWINYTNGDRVTKLLNDGEYLWATTYGGLTKLTKSTGEMSFYTKAQNGLPGNYLRGVAKDKDGILWIASYRNGIGKFDGTKTEIYNSSNSEIYSTYFLNVTIDKDNNPWFGSMFYLYKKEGDNWKRWRTPGKLIESNNSINQLQFDEEGVLWLAGDALSWIFAKFQNDTIKSIPGISYFGNAGNGLEIDGKTVWLASANGLFKYEGEEFTVYNTSNSQVPTNVFHDVRKDRAGNLWIACSGYLLKYDGSNFEQIRLPFGANGYVSHLVTDEDGVIWMGTSKNGLYRFKEGFFTSFNPSNSPLNTNTIGSSMVMDSQNNIWFNTDKGLIKIDANNQWTHYLESETSIKVVAVDPSDHVWITLGRRDTCVVKISPEGTTAFTTTNSPLPIDANSYNCIHSDRKGNTWLGTTKGLFRYNGTDWECFTSENSPLTSTLINCLATDPHDNLWGGTSNSLFKYDGTDWVIYTSQNSDMPSDAVSVLAFDTRKNAMWLNCGSGLTRFDETDWYTYNTGNSDIPSHTIKDIKVDKTGHIWLATDSGVTRFDGQNWIVYTTENSGMSYNGVSNITLDYHRDWIWLNHLSDYGISSARVDWGISGLFETQADAPAVFTLSPNPATTEVQVQCKPDLTGTISVRDISGKTLSRTTLKGSNVFPLQKLGITQNGLYLVQVTTPQGKYTQKLCVQK